MRRCSTTTSVERPADLTKVGGPRCPDLIDWFSESRWEAEGSRPEEPPMRRRRPRLFLKGKSPRARRRLLLVFALIFAGPVGFAAPRAARADCAEFSSQLTVGTTGSIPDALVWGDFDRDGDLDAAASSRNEL